MACMPRTINLVDVADAPIEAVFRPVRPPDNTHQLPLVIPLKDVARFPVDPVVWCALTGIAILSNLTSNVPLANASAMLPSTVTCLLLLYASSGT